MDSNFVTFITFVCVFGGGLIGLSMFRVLPSHHLTSETRDVVRLGIGMISVLASLVLGLLIASAKGSFDHTQQAIRSYAADLILLDQTLRNYGPPAIPVRGMLLRYAERAVATTWPEETPAKKQPLEDKDLGVLLNQILESVIALQPANENQTWMRGKALELASNLIHTRWALLVAQGGSISPVLVGIMIAWITVIFASFGLNAPRNATVVAAYFICALAISGSLYVILEMDTPFDGVIMVPSWSMKNALAHLSE